MGDVFESALDRICSWLGVNFEDSLDWHGTRFSPIRADLFLGARPGLEHARSLQNLGITHVVSVLPEEERPRMAFLRNDFETLFLAAHDGVEQDISTTIADFFAFADAAATRERCSKLLVHCEAGVSRSASLVIALIMRSQQKTFYDAYCQVRSKRAQILPNIGFAAQLQRLELELKLPNPRGADTDSLASFLHHACNVPADLELLQASLRRHNYDAVTALHEIFGPELPRVIQGLRY